MLNSETVHFIGCNAVYEDASIVLFGAPFDSTTSYRPGTRSGPRAIRSESFGLETYSAYQDRDLTDESIFDSGDLELCIGDVATALGQIGERTRVILDDGKLPLMLGGEHLVTLGAFREVAKRYPELHVIHFDAHADLRDTLFGARLSHACVLRRCYDVMSEVSPEGAVGKIHQFGIRSGDREEFEFAAKHTKMRRFDFVGLAETIESLGTTPVYFTVDLDVLDPSELPGTGTPEAGGVRFCDLYEAMATACRANVVGCDVTELAPNLDTTGASTAIACKTLRELLLFLTAR